MNDSENFVSRWSRLKRETADEKTKKDGNAAATEDAPPAVAPSQTASADPSSEPVFDASTLPSIEEITAGTDIRAFLQSGVPAELTKAALRRAWTADPAIRDFIGLAENQWDFTNPSTIPGFGPLEVTDDLPQLVARAMGEIADAAPEAETANALQQAETAGTSFETISSEPHASLQATVLQETNSNAAQSGGAVEKEDHRASAASQHVSLLAESRDAPSPRGHGRALPQ